jgi:hypothetical protein
MEWTLNYPCIPVLAVGFSRSTSIVGNLIRFFRGGFKAVGDPGFPNHAFLIVSWHGQKFAAEETAEGLKMDSLEQYSGKGERITEMYYCTCFDDPVKKKDSLDRISYILREQGNRHTKLGKYQTGGLFSFLHLASPDASGKDAEWCSENCADILKNYGKVPWIKDVHLAPDQLLNLMMFQKTGECSCEAVLNYYKY